MLSLSKKYLGSFKKEINLNIGGNSDMSEGKGDEYEDDFEEDAEEEKSSR
jgi:hypothetical protein